MARLRLFACAGLLMLTGCAAREVRVPGLQGEVTVAGEIVDRAVGLWPDAELRPVSACPTPSGDGAAAPATPAALSADLNGDGASDVVIRVEAEGRAHLVAALKPLDRAPEVVDMTGDEGLPPGTLSVEPRGTRYHREGSGLDLYFGAETVVLTGCDAARTAFVWTGSGFERVRLAAK